MASSKPSVQFSIYWKILWSEYKGITSSAAIGKRFITSHNNASLRWRAEFSLLPEGDAGDHSKNQFYLYYEDGPVEKINSMTYKIAIVKADQSICGEMVFANYVPIRSLGWGTPSSYDKDGPMLRQKYGLIESAPLIIRIVLQIPISVFTCKMGNPLPSASPPQQWMADLFKVIEDPQRSTFSNATMISRDGARFYCHKIISFQSTALDAMFRHPPPEGRPDGEYPFPDLSKDSLKVFLQYLYTGQASIEKLSMGEVIEVADAAEQYNLKPLKKACGSLLWDQVVEKPWICFEVVRFCDLHDDLKYLKYRAMEVLAENFEKMKVFKENVASRFGGGENGKRLREEFQLYVSRRVEAN